MNKKRLIFIFIISITSLAYGKTKKKNIEYVRSVSVNKSSSSETELFEKAFGKKTTISTGPLSLYYGKHYIGELVANIKSNGELVSISLPSLKIALKNFLTIEEYKKLESLTGNDITPNVLTFNIFFNQTELRLQINVNPTLINPIGEDNFRIRNKVEYGDITSPAIFGGIVNFKINESLMNSSLTDTNHVFSTNTSSSLNFKSYVLENQMYYSSINNGTVVIGDTTIVKDDIQNNLTYRLGDVHTGSFGYKDTIPVGGFSVRRNFNLDPDTLNNSGNYNEYVLTGRSKVRYFVNGSLLKTLDQDAGKYSVKDLPLNDGLNDISIEIEDEFGIKKSYSFNENFSSLMLKEGSTLFDITVGEKISFINQKRFYDKENIVKSTFIKHGWTPSITQSLYLQSLPGITLYGQKDTLSTRIGLIDLDTAISDSLSSGVGQSATLSLTTSNNKRSGKDALKLSLEKTSEKFRKNITSVRNKYKNSEKIYYQKSLTDKIYAGLGFENSSPFIRGEKNTVILSANLSYRIAKGVSSSMNLSTGYNEDHNKFKSVVLVFSFSENDFYLNSSYDSRSNNYRSSISGRENTYGVTPSASLGKKGSQESFNTDLIYRSRYGNFTASTDQSKESNNVTRGVSDISMSSSFSFGYSKKILAFSLSKPVSNSILIVKPSSHIDDQRISFYNRNDRISDQGIFNELSDTNLEPYKVKGFLIDPSELKDGYTIGKESFWFRPTYKSVSLIEVGSIGGVSLKGHIVDGMMNSQSNVNGTVESEEGSKYQFFSNSKGLVFIESIPRGKVVFKFKDGIYKDVAINIKEKEMGLVDIGYIFLEKAK